MIGGMAMVAYGVEYASTAVDFVYSSELENLERLSALLLKVNARVVGQSPNAPFALTPAVLRRVRFLNLTTDTGAIDLMREVPGVDSFEGLWERAVPMDLGGFTVRVASLDDLIAIKRAANRPKDQPHCANCLP
jgi:hypothetical protein